MYIRLAGGGLFNFAGLYTQRQDAEGNPVASCAIITTAANELMVPIHQRMPVILDRSDEALWLDPSVTNPAAVLPCLRAYPAEAMEAWPVSTLVNDVRRDEPLLIEPAAQ
jgi:putative SOS response-associated peptidase YedK